MMEFKIVFCKSELFLVIQYVLDIYAFDTIIFCTFNLFFFLGYLRIFAILLNSNNNISIPIN